MINNTFSYKKVPAFDKTTGFQGERLTLGDLQEQNKEEVQMVMSGIN